MGTIRDHQQGKSCGVYAAGLHTLPPIILFVVSGFLWDLLRPAQLAESVIVWDTLFLLLFRELAGLSISIHISEINA